MTNTILHPSHFPQPLTPRERFRRVMHYQWVDRIPHWEFGYWASLKDRWVAEGHLPAGLPEWDGEIRNDAVERLFGCDQPMGIGTRLGPGPMRERQLVENRNGKVCYRDGLGILCEEVQEGIRSIPHFLEFPIKNRQDWLAFRDEFLRIDDGWRAFSSQEIDTLAEQAKASTVPVGIWFGSFIGWIRDWIGFENLAYLLYDDPALIAEMSEHLTALKLKYLAPLLERIEFDYASGWEDICYNSGPLISPKLFKKLIVPHMQPVLDLLQQHGIHIIYTDCDGNIEALLPYWMEHGLNVMFPLEVQANNDITRLREQYGRQLLVLGGFDKFALLHGKQAVLNELKRLEPYVMQGGFIPFIDHRCPDGVQFDVYQFYMREKLTMLGYTQSEIQAIPLLSKS